MTTFLLGDCIEKMKQLPDKSVDLFMCDLPYGQLDTSERENNCAWDVKIDLAAFWEQVERLAKTDNTPVLHFCNVKFGHELITSKPKWFRYDLVWNKERGVNFLHANKMPMKSHEMVYVFSKKGAFYNRVDISGNFTAWKASEHYADKVRVAKVAGGVVKAAGNDGTRRCALSVINIRKPNTLGHPTEKPIELYKWLIERYSPEGGTVLDPTAGSFNSIRAAVQLKRRGIGIEKDRGFFYKAVADFVAIKK